jgi:hypothetical protein
MVAIQVPVIGSKLSEWTATEMYFFRHDWWCRGFRSIWKRKHAFRSTRARIFLIEKHIYECLNTRCMTRLTMLLEWCMIVHYTYLCVGYEVVYTLYSPYFTPGSLILLWSPQSYPYSHLQGFQEISKPKLFLLEQVRRTKWDIIQLWNCGRLISLNRWLQISNARPPLILNHELSSFHPSCRKRFAPGITWRLIENVVGAIQYEPHRSKASPRSYMGLHTAQLIDYGHWQEECEAVID